MTQTAIPGTNTRHTTTRTLNVPLNRVEGDLEIRVQLTDDVVSDAWSSGTMYRGFESMLVGRAALDSLVITPRICGICSTAHLLAAARALDSIAGTPPPPDAVRIRNIALMTELLQSDIRQTVLMFAADFANPAHADQPLYAEAVRRYAPLKGESVLQTIRHTKQVLEIVAILGGQWPHSSYMVPGGIVTIPTAADLFQCRHVLSAYRNWYEQRILGCALERWQAVRTAADLDTWLAEDDAHRNSDLGFFIRYAQALGLQYIGRGHGRFISVGGLDIPAGSAVRNRRGEVDQLLRAGFVHGTRIAPFDQRRITEDVSHAWFIGPDRGVHPFDGTTQPCPTGDEGRKYTWAKAPRYDGQPAETGPLAELLISGHPLFRNLVDTLGSSAYTRQLARIVRPAELIPAMEQWLSEITPDGTYYTHGPRIEAGESLGATEATRGALGHWVKIADGKIAHYQIITPTAWNGAPRDAQDVRGPWEQALIGTPVRDPVNPVELGYVIRSFDPCLVCTVHAVRGTDSLARRRL